MTPITIYRIRSDAVFGGDVEILVNDPVMSPIPARHTRESPHPIPEGHYAVMRGGWKYIAGTAPGEPDTATPAQWAAIRARRNDFLAATDWWVTKAAETGNVLAADKHVYRQALRDITTQPDPFNIVWPELPGEPVEGE